MMRSERKTEKWRIPGKWTLIFLLILLAFYGYQNILAENYERQVVSWIGQTEKDRTVSAFTEPDEEAYQKGCEALKEAGYEETGKIWLKKNPKLRNRCVCGCDRHHLHCWSADRTAHGEKTEKSTG